MSGVFLVGRIILGLFFLSGAFQHFTKTADYAKFVAMKGLPMPSAAVIVTGTLLLIMGLTFLLGVMPRLGVLASVLFFLPVTFIMHAFWSDTDPMMKMMNVSNFLKNLAIFGSTLMFLAIPEPWPYSLGHRLQLRRALRQGLIRHSRARAARGRRRPRPARP